MTEESSAGSRTTRLALAMVSAGVILWQILLTRIFSVILFYHYAFLSISVAMFGLTLGALLVLVRSGRPSAQNLDGVLGRLGLTTAALMTLGHVIQLFTPLRFQSAAAPSLYLAVTYLLSALPLVPAGAFICLALTRVRPVAVLYAFDLIGAATGCALVPVVTVLFGGPGAILVTAALVGTAGYLQLRASERRLALAGLGGVLALVAFAAANRDTHWLRVRWRHDGPVKPPLYEAWNAFSRVAVSVYPDRAPFGWGIDPELRAAAKPVEQLWLEIDSGAATPITRFAGDTGSVDFLRLDLSSFAHYLRQDADVLVIGSGGGRDVLSALSFRQTSVSAVDVNPAINHALNDVFGDFSGHLDAVPKVEFVTDEGRSYLARNARRFDIIQASLVDTVAATAAGAYAFTENGLYTVEAWRLFLSRLKPGGLLTMSRWWFGVTTWPVEVSRLLTLATAALRSTGIEDPRAHILLVRSRSIDHGVEGLATIMLSPDPIGPTDVVKARRACEELRCVIALGPNESESNLFGRLVDSRSNRELDRLVALDVTPPTDDRPYFFFYDRLRDVLSGSDDLAYGGSSFNRSAVRLLVVLGGLSLLLAAALVVIPVVALKAAGRWPRSDPSMRLAPLYFAGIGVAFMCVEVGFMQRLSIFLGHPVYGFTVALFGFLLASGIGSLASARLRPEAERAWLVLGLIGPVVALAAAASSLLIRVEGAPTTLRIMIALALMGPPAFLMGFGFPLAMDLARSRDDGRTAWYWAINGAASVVAAVLAMVACLAIGVRATIAAGAVSYLLTALVYRKMAASRPSRELAPSDDATSSADGFPAAWVTADPAASDAR